MDNHSILRFGNILYIRMSGRFSDAGYIKMNDEVLAERRAFKGKVFLQILDLRTFDLDEPESMEMISDKAADTDKLHPASSVVVADSDRLKEKIHAFFALPDRPIYPVTYRNTCEEAFEFFVEQGLITKERADQWHSRLARLY